MKLLFYENTDKGAVNRIQSVIQGLVPENCIEIYRTISSLSLRLRKPMDETVIAVLLAARQEDLVDILFIGDLLYDINTILVLPDSEDDTVKKGHQLRPRYLSYMDSNFSDVGAVLGNMLKGFLTKTKKPKKESKADKFL